TRAKFSFLQLTTMPWPISRDGAHASASKLLFCAMRQSYYDRQTKAHPVPSSRENQRVAYNGDIPKGRWKKNLQKRSWHCPRHEEASERRCLRQPWLPVPHRLKRNPQSKFHRLQDRSGFAHHSLHNARISSQDVLHETIPLLFVDCTAHLEES